MSIFTSLVSEVWPVPGTSETITIRKLAPRALEKARRVAREAANDEMRLTRESLGEAEYQSMKAEIAAAVAAHGTSESAAADPLAMYDPLTLAQAGVTAWSFTTPKCSPEAVAEIDADTLDALARAILRLSKPSLFQTPEQQAEAQGNG